MALGALELERLLVRLVMDAKQFKSELRSSEGMLRGSVRGMIGIASKLAIGAGAGFAALGALSIKAASDAEETSAKFNTVFESIQGSADRAAANLDANFGLARGDAEAMLSATGDMLVGFGFTEKGALDLSEQVQQLSVDLASFQNLEGGAERASKALTKGLLGERESMKELGIAILEEDVKKQMAIMRSQGMVFATEREAKARATLMLALQQSKKAIGDYARTQDSFANQSRELKSDIDDLAVMFGKVLMPAAMLVMKGIRRVVNWVKSLQMEFAAAEFVAQNFGLVWQTVMVNAGLKIEQLVGNVKHFFTGILPALFNWFGRNWREVFVDAGNLAMTVANNIVMSYVQLFKNLIKVVRREMSFKDIMSGVNKDLTKGFTSALRELPEIPKRELGLVEKVLTAEAARLNTKLGMDFSKAMLKRQQELNRARADAEPKGLTKVQKAAKKAEEIRKKAEKPVEVTFTTKGLEGTLADSAAAAAKIDAARLSAAGAIELKPGEQGPKTEQEAAREAKKQTTLQEKMLKELKGKSLVLLPANITGST